MNGLVKDLKEVMDDKKISMETASHYLHCSSKTIFRWLKGENDPGLNYQRLIQDGIDKIKKAFPEKKKQRIYLSWIYSFCPDLNLSEEQKDFYEKVLETMTMGVMSEKLFHKGITPEAVDKEIMEFSKRYKSLK